MALLSRVAVHVGRNRCAIRNKLHGRVSLHPEGSAELDEAMSALHLRALDMNGNGAIDVDEVRTVLLDNRAVYDISESPQQAQADGDAKALAAMEELRERNRLEIIGIMEEHDKRLMEDALERMGLSLLALRPLLYGWAKAVKRDKRKRTAILRWRDNQTWRLLDAWRDFSEEKRATRKLHVVAMVWSQEYALNICMQKWRAVITSLAYTFVRQKDLAERASKSLRTLIFYSRGGDLFSTWAMYAALRSRVYALMAIGTSGYVESRWRQGWLAFVAVAVEAHAVRRWERQRLSLAWAAWLERWVGTLKGRWRRGEQVMDQAERRRRRDSLGVGSPSLLELS